MLNKDNLPIVSLLPPSVSVSVSVSGSVGLTSQLTKLDIGSDPYCQDGRVVVNRTLLVPTPFDPPHLVMDNQIAPSTLLESWVRVLVGRHLKMPIPTRTSAAGTAPYPWRIELHAVNLLRPTSDPWNHPYDSFKKLDAGLIKRTKDAKRHARVVRELPVTRRTILNSVALAVYGEAASPFAQSQETKLRVPPLAAEQAASDANCASFMRCNRRADGFSANRPILPSSPGDSGRSSFHRAVSFVHAPGLARCLSKTCIYRRQTLRADHCSE
ncbi:hypothetical protein Trihar35433_3172 [Trichoderma harzianum]|nr:hypothetical protein Trihar35433_3172 [Trichoderma harzianum]